MQGSVLRLIPSRVTPFQKSEEKVKEVDAEVA